MIKVAVRVYLFEGFFVVTCLTILPKLALMRILVTTCTICRCDIRKLSKLLSIFYGSFVTFFAVGLFVRPI